jgi:hypothetical protein
MWLDPLSINNTVISSTNSYSAGTSAKFGKNTVLLESKIFPHWDAWLQIPLQDEIHLEPNTVIHELLSDRGKPVT